MYFKLGIVTEYISEATALMFLASFLFNILKRSDNFSVCITSAVLAVSYMLTTFGYDFINSLANPIKTQEVYLLWMKFDAITIISLFLLHMMFRIKQSVQAVIIYRILAISMTLQVAMHIDINVLSNLRYWFLWTIYSYGVNALDIIMVITLFMKKSWSEVFSRWKYYFSFSSG